MLSRHGLAWRPTLEVFAAVWAFTLDSVRCATFVVHNQDEFLAAISSTHAGDTIELNDTIALSTTVDIFDKSGITVASSSTGERFALEGDGTVSLLRIGGTSATFRNIELAKGKGNALDTAGVQVRGGSDLEFLDVVFKGNRIPEPSLAGGALWAFGGAKVRLRGCEFVDNRVGGGETGSAIRIEKAEVSMTSCTFRENIIGAGLGGAVYMYTGANVVMEKSTFKDNVNSAGAITVNAWDVVERLSLVGCTFSGNAGFEGSRDVYLYDFRVPEEFEIASECTANTADIGASGALACKDCPGGPYPSAFTGVCQACDFYSPWPGSWRCDPPACSTIANPAEFCADANRTTLVEGAEGISCVGDPGPQCAEDDMLTCCAATCASITDVGSFCGGVGYGLGLVEDSATATCQGAECVREVDQPTCCATTTTTATRTTTTRSTTTSTETTTTTTSTTETATTTTTTTVNTTTITTTSTGTNTTTSQSTTSSTGSTTSTTTSTATLTRTSTSTTTTVSRASQTQTESTSEGIISLWTTSSGSFNQTFVSVSIAPHQSGLWVGAVVVCGLSSLLVHGVARD